MDSDEEAPPVEASTSTATRASRVFLRKRRKVTSGEQTGGRVEQQRTSEVGDMDVDEGGPPVGESTSRDRSPCAQKSESESLADENLEVEEQWNPGSGSPEDQNALLSSSPRSSESSASSAESRQK